MMKNSIYMSVAAATVLLAACASDITDATGQDAQGQDSRISVAMGLRSLEVATRATETVTAQSFAGREPTEENPFHPWVWFTRTQGDYSDEAAKWHNKVKFTSATLTFPDTDVEYDTANPGNYTYCIGLYPTDNGLWGIEDTSDWTDEQRAALVGSCLAADIEGQQDLMFAAEEKGSINDKFKSTILGENDAADNRLQFHHLLTWLKIRVTAGEQGAGESWGKVKLLEVKTQQHVRMDLGTGKIFEQGPATDSYQVKAFAPDPTDVDNPQQYKDLEPATPEDPQIASVLVVPATEYEITYQTEQMLSPAKTTVQLKDINGGNITLADDARNKVFVITLSFFTLNKVEASCTLEPMTDEQDALYGTTATPLTVGAISGSFTYNGSAHTPTPSVTGATAGTGGYTVTYSNNINAGTAVVTALGTGADAGRVGSKTFTIHKASGGGSISYTPSSVDKTYGDAAFTHPLTNGLTGAGTVSYTITYASSDEGVATVNASTGMVTIQNAGSATITANVDDGDNHTYSEPKPSASYTLNVAKRAGTIGFTSAAKSGVLKTYGDDAFTYAVDKLGDGTVEYTSSDPAVASVNTSTGEVTILKSGDVTITATVTDGTNYTYASTTDTYNLKVNKAAGSISYEVSSLNMTKNDANFTNPLSNKGPKNEDATGSVTYSSSNTSVATVDPVTGLVDIIDAGYAVITATVTDNDQYTYETKVAKYTIVVSQ